MDWKFLLMAFLPVISGLGGAWIMGTFNEKIQRMNQRNENIRHLRKIAFETATQDWKGVKDFLFWRVEREDKAREPYAGETANVPGTPYPIPVLDEYLIHHLTLVEELLNINLPKATAGDITAIIRRVRTRTRNVHAFRREFEQELCNVQEPVRDKKHNP